MTVSFFDNTWSILTVTIYKNNVAYPNLIFSSLEQPLLPVDSSSLKDLGKATVGALIGTLFGAFLGLIFGSKITPEEQRQTRAVIQVVIFTPLGLLFGASVGANWE